MYTTFKYFIFSFQVFSLLLVSSRDTNYDTFCPTECACRYFPNNNSLAPSPSLVVHSTHPYHSCSHFRPHPIYLSVKPPFKFLISPTYLLPTLYIQLNPATHPSHKPHTINLYPVRSAAMNAPSITDLGEKRLF